MWVELLFLLSLLSVSLVLHSLFESEQHKHMHIKNWSTDTCKGDLVDARGCYEGERKWMCAHTCGNFPLPHRCRPPPPRVIPEVEVFPDWRGSAFSISVWPLEIAQDVSMNLCVKVSNSKTCMKPRLIDARATGARKLSNMQACVHAREWRLYTQAQYICVKRSLGFKDRCIFGTNDGVCMCVCACMSVPLTGYGGERPNVPGVHLWVMATVMSWKHNLYLPSLCVRKKGQEQKRDCVCASQY